MEKSDQWTKEVDQVNRVQVSRTPVSVSMIREATQRDPVLSRVMHFLLHGWPEKENVPEQPRCYHTKQDEFTIEDGCLLRGTRVVIPSKYQEQVLVELHMDHPGMVRMKSIARLHVRWCTLDRDIEQTVRDCHEWQTNRCKFSLKVSIIIIIQRSIPGEGFSIPIYSKNNYIKFRIPIFV